jgi:hypothetical protein
MASLGGKPEVIAQMLTIFNEHDNEVRVAQSLEPEWLAVERPLAIFYMKPRISSGFVQAGIEAADC